MKKKGGVLNSWARKSNAQHAPCIQAAVDHGIVQLLNLLVVQGGVQPPQLSAQALRSGKRGGPVHTSMRYFATVQHSLGA